MSVLMVSAFIWFALLLCVIVLNSIHKITLVHGRCKSKARLDGKTALVTGCNTGIGRETAMDLYRRGARVIMACRNQDKAYAAKLHIEETCKNLSGLGSIALVQLDLMSLKSVRACAQQILDTEPQLNILINNAGVMMCPKGETEDGFETHLGTNHLGHFLLTLLLLPRIKNSTPARIVTVASMAHILIFRMNFEDLNYKSTPFSTIQAYSRSKAANILFTRELAARLEQYKIKGVNTYCVHPGIIATELGRHLDITVMSGARWVWRQIANVFAKTPLQGAQTTIYCAVDEKASRETGFYYSECVAIKPWNHAAKRVNAKKLWELSSDFVNLGDFDPFTAPDEGIKNRDYRNVANRLPLQET